MRVTISDREIVEKSAAVGARRLRVGVAGLGVVGGGAALELIGEAARYELCAVLVRDREKPRAPELDGVRKYTDVGVFLSEGPDVIIDALPCGDAGRVLIERALEQGVSVVSANKQAVFGSLARFHRLAADNKAAFAYSASVGGGAPMVETVRKARSAGEIKSLTAIVNGAVNYILTLVGSGVSFDEAVARAQAAGFAEPDPAADLSGDDARAKASILAFEAFGVEIAADKIEVEALDAARADHIVRDGRAWRQLTRIEKLDRGVAARIAYECVDGDGFFRAVRDEGNALRVVNATGADFTCADKGAGRGPTVRSLFADLEAIHTAAADGAQEISLKNPPPLS
ncbi:MAG: hypothetical protein GXP06_09425 [Alphaproteobacteria bacterium]|nr:hypothetical protein [Alphaproteobacteria bacterium]